MVGLVPQKIVLMTGVFVVVGFAFAFGVHVVGVGLVEVGVLHEFGGVGLAVEMAAMHFLIAG